jgi:hypothetical protein
MMEVQSQCGKELKYLGDFWGKMTRKRVPIGEGLELELFSCANPLGRDRICGQVTHVGKFPIR